MAPLTRHLNPSDALHVDRHIWKACAGASVNLPPVQSVVYYFPQGHAEHADKNPVVFSARVYSTPCVRCRVVSLEYLARADTDEVFAKLRMRPVGGDGDDDQADEEDDRVMDEVEEEKSVRSFVKVLTSSDANNGGGFSMPKACADIFPKLDFQADPPVQQLSMFDLQGKVWEFRHIYRGTPLRHLLTTGWGRFVNSKKLIHGDSVVFIRDTRINTLFITVRRAISRCSVEWTNPHSQLPVAETMDFGSNFSRRALGKVPTEEVIEAAELAVAGEEFEIDYYPGAGWPSFVVNAELVDRTWRFPWSLNIKVKMSMETEESPRVGLVKGTVVAVSGYDKSGLWDKRSPWRMLKVHWDDPKVGKDDEWISPWELEIDNPPWEAHYVHPLDTPRPPERMSNIAAAPPPRFNLNLSENTRLARIEVPTTNVPSSGSPVHIEATSVTPENIQGNKVHDTGSIKLFGKIISYERKPEGNGST